MSKYIIDLRPDCKVVQQICESDGQVSIGAKSIEYLEELNADYVNEHFGSLQDDAYKRGLENGKKEAESSEAIEQAKADAFNNGMLFKEEKIHDAFLRGVEKGKVQGQNEAWECARKIVCDDSCGGMSMKELVEIFNKSSDAYILRDFTAQQAIEMLKAHKQEKDDNIEVGDEVEVLNSGNKYLIAWFAGTSICGFAHDGVTCRLQPSDVRKTGRHFDIAKILEDMKHD